MSSYFHIFIIIIFIIIIVIIIIIIIIIIINLEQMSHLFPVFWSLILNR